MVIVGAHMQALEHFENYYDLTKGNNWKFIQHFEDLNRKEIDKINMIKKTNIQENIRNLADDKLFTDACIHLQRIYKIMSNKYAKTQDKKIEYLTKAYEICKSSNYKQ